MNKKKRKNDRYAPLPSMYVKRNAGNPEKNQEIFNAAMDTGNQQAAIASGNQTAARGLSESMHNDRDIDELISLIDYNGAEYRGAQIPQADPFMINQINLPDNMRLKWFDVDKIDDNTLQLTYVTQEPFTSKDAEKFIAEIKRFFEAITEHEDFDRQFSVALDVTCRDGEEYGHLVYDLHFNKETKMNENLDNIVDVEDKSREAVSPAFGAAVREIKKNNETEEVVTAIKDTPKQGEEDLPEDTKITLDESLFEERALKEKYWEKKIPSDIAHKFRSIMTSDEEKIGPAMDAVESILSWIEKEYPDNSYEVNEIRQNMSMIDHNDFCDADFDDGYNEDEYEPRTVEEYFNQEVLDYVYDLCDALNIWIPTDMDECLKESRDFQGWEIPDEIKDDIFYHLQQLTYEINNGVRGAYTGVRTYEDLGHYIKQLAEDLNQFGENVSSLEEPESPTDESINNSKKYLLEIGRANNVSYEVERHLFDSLEDAEEEFEKNWDELVKETVENNMLEYQEALNYREEVEETKGQALDCVESISDPDGEWYVHIVEIDNLKESKLLTRISKPAEEKFTADMKLRDAYKIYDPEEFQLDKIRNDITVEEIWNKMRDGEDFYITASVDGEGFDSAVREGLFNIMEQALNINYDEIYDMWLYGRK